MEPRDWRQKAPGAPEIKVAPAKEAPGLKPAFFRPRIHADRHRQCRVSVRRCALDMQLERTIVESGRKQAE
jgi:hypothetical protein